MIIITSPSLDVNKNIGGISSITQFIINNNKEYDYRHFEIGKFDDQKRNISWLFKILKAYFKWLYLLFSYRNILIHFNLALNSRSIIRDFPLIIFARILRRKLLIHIHGGEYLEKEAGVFLRRLLITILRGKEPIIVSGTHEKNLLSKKYFAKNIYVLPNCADINEARGFARIFSDEKQVKILFLGRIDRAKGLDYMVDAFRILRNKGIRFRFIMAGTGPEEDEYVERFSEILGPDFEFKGLVWGLVKTELLKQCDVFLLPSLFEGLPLSLLESMSFAMVPVVTSVGSIGDVVKDEETGIIVEMRSSEKIAEALGRLVNNPNLLVKLGGRARDYIFLNYDPDNYLNELNKLYRSL